MAANNPLLRVLHVAAEVFPIVKTGGLGDVVAALPPALAHQGIDVRLLLPGYPDVLDALTPQRTVVTVGPAFGAATLALQFGTLRGVDVPVYVIDAPFLYRREGNPYLAPDGNDWSDNPLRFGALAWFGAHLGGGDLDRGWVPQIVHTHDWHAALASTYLALNPAVGCRSILTIHNLAFHGLFAPDLLSALQLPLRLLSIDGFEYHGQGSALKAGIQFADRVTTVSPTYANEIRTPEFGCGLDGVLDHHAGKLRGILNGADDAVWNPATDALIQHRYDAANLHRKALCKAALQKELGLAVAPEAPLFAVTSRLTHQKGIDLVLRTAPDLLAHGAQIVVLGGGESPIEHGLRALSYARPDAIAVNVTYDEALAHRIMAGADVIVVPSRFEPCGLTQLYGLRYGTLPLVRRVGGLADSVIDADDQTLAEDTATGFAFDTADAQGLRWAALRAIKLFAEPARWQQVQLRAMAQDFTWQGAARHYLELYRELGGVADSKPAPAKTPAAAQPAGR